MRLYIDLPLRKALVAQNQFCSGEFYSTCYRSISYPKHLLSVTNKLLVTPRIKFVKRVVNFCHNPSTLLLPVLQ